MERGWLNLKLSTIIDNPKNFFIGLGMVILLSAIWGYNLSASKAPQIIERPVERRVEIVKEVCPNLEAWKKLKEIDDQGFLLAADGFNIVSTIFDDISRMDMESIEKHNKELGYKSQQMSILMNEDRKSILRTLGY